MRMFLVAMCDIFLLLYLTAISQQESAPLSKITLQDYRKLEKLHRESEINDEEYKTQISDLSEEKLSLLQKLELAEGKLKETENKAKAALTEKEKESLDALEKSRLAEEEKLAALEKQKKAEEEARQALLQSKKAKEEAESALTKEQLALAAAEREKINAAEKEKLALLTAEKAILAEEKAVMAEEKAERAQNRVALQKQKLNSVLQPMDKAYKENIETKLYEIKVFIRREGIFGDRTLTLGSVGAASNFGGSSVIFQSLKELRLDQRMSGLLEVRIEVDGEKIEGVFVHPEKPLIGLILNVPVKGGKVLGEKVDIMPTLVAVRNNRAENFSDKMRGLDPQKFFLQRDKLVPDGKNVLSYKAEGFRGTGDYGEVIMAGDQIVDLDGNLLGIGIDRNLVAPIGKSSEWDKYVGNEDAIRQIFSKIE